MYTYCLSLVQMSSRLSFNMHHDNLFMRGLSKINWWLNLELLQYNPFCNLRLELYLISEIWRSKYHGRFTNIECILFVTVIQESMDASRGLRAGCIGWFLHTKQDLIRISSCRKDVQGCISLGQFGQLELRFVADGQPCCL